MPPAGCEGLAGANAAEVLNTMHDRVDSDLVYTRMQVFLYLNNNTNILAVQLVGRAAKCLRPEKAEMLQSKVWRIPRKGLPYTYVHIRRERQIEAAQSAATPILGPLNTAL